MPLGESAVQTRIGIDPTLHMSILCKEACGALSMQNTPNLTGYLRAKPQPRFQRARGQLAHLG
jgi:hypothetical protein